MSQMSPKELEQRRAAANPPKDESAELLETGQEEVFSRTEVETGRTEHADQAGRHHTGPPDRSADELLKPMTSVTHATIKNAFTSGT